MLSSSFLKSFQIVIIITIKIIIILEWYEDYELMSGNFLRSSAFLSGVVDKKKKEKFEVKIWSYTPV